MFHLPFKLEIYVKNKKQIFIEEWTTMIDRGIIPVVQTEDGVININYNREKDMLETGTTCNHGLYQMEII